MADGLKVSLVALPIGNSADLSARAGETLVHASHIFCEDSRKLRELATRANLSLKARVTSLPGGEEHEFDWEKLFSKALGDEHWVLVSDAGTPVVNDPGAALLSFCRMKKIAVQAVPGPSAPMLAWQWTGGFGLPFVFAGFVPKARSADTQALNEFFADAARAGTFCFFDTRYQVATTLKHLNQGGWKDAKIYLTREMTKPYEEILSGTVTEVEAEIKKRLSTEEPLGELTLLLEGRKQAGAPVSGDGQFTVDELSEIRSLPPKAAAKLVASRMKEMSASQVYDVFSSKGAPKK